MREKLEAVSRREALRRAALVLGGVVAAPALAGCGQPGADGALGEEAAAAGAATRPAAGRNIGVQLYTVRDLMERDVAATLEQVANLGYREVEFAGYFDHSPEQIRAMLDRVGLSAPSTHVPIDALRGDLDGTLAAAETIGHRHVVVPWLAPAERTREGYRRLAADLNRFGAAARDRGIRIGYHNHDFEFQPLPGGGTGYDILLAETDPALVDLQLDLFWAVKAGQDPLALFARHPGRFPLWHVKDMADIQGAQRMVPVGQGEIDFGRIFARAEQAGLRHFFVEHDQPDDPIATLRTSQQHLARLLP